MTMTMLAIIASTVDGIKTELALFLLAFFLHMVVFRGHNVRTRKGYSPKSGKPLDGPNAKGGSKTAGSCAKGGPSPSQTPQTSQKFVLAAMSAAESLCTNGGSKQAFTAKVRDELQQVPIDERVDALTSLLQGAAKSKVASEELLAAVHTLLEENHLKLSMGLAECFLHGHLAHGNMPKVQRTLETMRSLGLMPRVCAFNELLVVAVKKCPKQVWDLVDEMKICGAKPDRITCAILLKTVQASPKSAHLERILTLLDDIGGDMDEVLLSSVVEACLCTGRPDLLEPHLKQRTIKRVQVKSSHTFGSIIRAYGSLKDIKGVWDTWREMRTRHVMPTSITLGCMVEALTTNGDVEAGYEFVRDISKDDICSHQINAVIYGSVLKGFAQQKQFDRVWSVYQEMLDLKLQFSIVTFNTLVDACARSHDMSRIPALLESMVAQGIEPNIITYSAILKGYCQANRLDEAFQLMAQMMQTTDLRPDEIMYNTLLDGCARQGLYDKGMQVLAEMQQVGVPPTNFTLSVLVKLASRSKRLDSAFELCDEISSKYKFRLNMHVYSNLVHGCVMGKDLGRGMQVLQKMLSERVRPDARTYDSLLRACIAEHRAKDAAGLLRAALGLRNVHPSLVDKPASLLQPQGRLTVELIENVLDGIAGICRDPKLAVELLQDLRRVPGLKLDPKLQLRLATKSGQF
mmetsp:Transcript_141739/g.246770  ORF Transcript_141739/g.246770 Transcript_141739/m.246770 type:complete len:688 (-) Transcript_141739:158-2221(-)